MPRDLWAVSRWRGQPKNPACYCSAHGAKILYFPSMFDPTPHSQNTFRTDMLASKKAFTPETVLADLRAVTQRLTGANLGGCHLLPFFASHPCTAVSVHAPHNCSGPLFRSLESIVTHRARYSVQGGLLWSERKHGLFTEQFPVSAYIGSSKNLRT